jgi:2-keto-4-pentenoate hydratase
VSRDDVRRERMKAENPSAMADREKAYTYRAIAAQLSVIADSQTCQGMAFGRRSQLARGSKLAVAATEMMRLAEEWERGTEAVAQSNAAKKTLVRLVTPGETG